MSNYPNILTPPMDSPEFLIYSPGSDRSSVSPPMRYGQVLSPESPDISMTGSQPSLEILEDPVEKFRFRYKSEMAGTHGSLNGRNSDRSRRQTFPSVKLLNFCDSAIIRCSLYQIGRREPHAHRLVKRIGPEEMDDPHDIEVGPELGFTANFISMGIIHTAKKHIVGELIRKYTVLKRETIIRNEGSLRLLTAAEELEIAQKAELENNNINLNQVCLRFDAFSKSGEALFPICPPVYSGIINNLKSAQTGDLKIVRMDHCSSTSRGGREIFILVEKVTKKNIKVRFFELNDDDQEIWSDYGRFSDLDVHHQYAIVFKTPAYRTIDIDKQVKVYIELQRPSDGARSEPKDFTYTPCDIIQNRKRARNMFSSNSTSSSFSSKELPAILPILDFTVNSGDLEEALSKNNIDSEEFLKVVDHLLIRNPKMPEMLGPADYTMDTSPARSYKGKISHLSREEQLILTVKSELGNFFHGLRNSSGDSKQRVQLMLENVLNDEKYKLDSGDNVLHLLALKNNYNQDFLINLLKLLCKYEVYSAVNIRNTLGLTPLHFAVKTRHKKAIELLLEAKADISVQDRGGNSPLHHAIMGEVPENILQLLFQEKDTQHFVNLTNNEGNTALHLAVKTNNLMAIKVLSINDADLNLTSNTNGYTPLHMAVADQHQTLVKYLLDQECDTSREDFNGSNALVLAKYLIDNQRPATLEIYQILEKHMKLKGTFKEVNIKEDEESSDMDIDFIKSEPDFEEEGLRLKYEQMCHLPDECTLKIGKLLNPRGRWIELADRLNYGHLVRSDLFKNDLNPTKSFLDFLMANCYGLLPVRTQLVLMKEVEAVKILDEVVKLEPDVYDTNQ